MLKLSLHCHSFPSFVEISLVHHRPAMCVFALVLFDSAPHPSDTRPSGRCPNLDAILGTGAQGREEGKYREQNRGGERKNEWKWKRTSRKAKWQERKVKARAQAMKKMQERKMEINKRKEQNREVQSSPLWLAFNGISLQSHLAWRVIAVDSHNVLMDWCEWLIFWLFPVCFIRFTHWATPELTLKWTLAFPASELASDLFWWGLGWFWFFCFHFSSIQDRNLCDLQAQLLELCLSCL